MSQNQYDQPKTVYFASNDTSFTTGDGTVTLDVIGTLLRNSVDGYIINDGDGAITVTLSSDGTNYGNKFHTIKDQVFSLKTLSIAKIRLVAVATSAYRVFCV